MREFDFQGRNPNNHPSGGTPGTVVVTGSISLHRQSKNSLWAPGEPPTKHGTYGFFNRYGRRSVA